MVVQNMRLVDNINQLNNLYPNKSSSWVDTGPYNNKNFYQKAQFFFIRKRFQQCLAIIF